LVRLPYQPQTFAAVNQLRRPPLSREFYADSMSLSGRPRWLVAMLASLALVATACGGSESVVATQAPAEAATEAPTAPAQAEPSAPEPATTLVSTTVDGGQIDFGSLAGQDVVLWFWAPW